MARFSDHYDDEPKVKKDKRSLNKNKRKKTKDITRNLTIESMYDEDVDYEFDE